MTLWLYLHFPAIQLDKLKIAEQTQKPDETELDVITSELSRPCIIVGGRDNRVMQLDQAAQQLGISAGMGLAAAAARSRELVVHPYDEVDESRTIREIAQWLYLITADIALFAPQGVLLKVSGMLAMYLDLSHYLSTLRSHLDTQSFTYRFAFGYSPEAARLLAKQHGALATQDPEVLEKALHGLPLVVLSLPAKQLERLQRVGFKTVGDLFALPLVELGKRFDCELVQYVSRLRGKVPHPVTFYQPEAEFERYLPLLYDIENLDWLNKPLLKLLVQQEQFLRLRNRHARQLILTLYQRDAEPLKLEVGRAEGTDRADLWLNLCNLKLSSVTLSGPVQAIGLKVAQICQPDELMHDLFAEQRGMMTPAGLVAVLQAKLGERAVQGLAAGDDSRPELATGYCTPLSVLGAPLSGEHFSETPLLYPEMGYLRPAFLLPSIQPLQHKINVHLGPERICTGWWDGHEVERDYFVAQDTQGRWLWVFRDRQQRWFCHGVFS
ncbi:DNA polymerase Y family protein [Pseudoalteromonas sp. R3]|uniref:Y-family DNA polymerase n=1 Tax=Pseudoalteromonas sp. R3 TaxID=1709477 RepID=UPI000FDE5497|nr:DNA polymerase Y family protein [Pseudoalteromonas sp. R3]AZZ99057.1 DNA polymerase Y family protein [Pseudoalteromonas sp. R3]